MHIHHKNENTKNCFTMQFRNQFGYMARNYGETNLTTPRK